MFENGYYTFAIDGKSQEVASGGMAMDSCLRDLSIGLRAGTIRQVLITFHNHPLDMRCGGDCG